MRRFLKNKAVLKNCKIYQMLSLSAGKKHLSFHTPGHKIGRWDITELSFSDNLSCPDGCIAAAEKDIAEALGAKKSFLLTDGSTSGVLAILYAAKSLGVKKIALSKNSHKSVFNGCKLLGITPLLYSTEKNEKNPFPPTRYELNEKFSAILDAADALFFTSPDYYGNVADLAAARAYCDEKNKLLLVDGAHGGHLHFDRNLYAGAYADMWVDGVHKNLPAFTQGAVVSARTEKTATALREAVDIFRTTSPSYPIMASVEYAVKYPRNLPLENAVRAFAKNNRRVYCGEDWTKLCATFGEQAFEVEKRLEKEGVYAEFCDGNILMFYLSPATSMRQFTYLTKKLTKLFAEYPLVETDGQKTQKKEQPQGDLLNYRKNQTEWVELNAAVGRICAADCGLFPPCTPLLTEGQRVTEEEIRLLKKANNVFGLNEGKILVYAEKDFCAKKEE